MDADVEISKPGESSHSVAAKDVKITTTIDTLVKGMLIFHHDGEAGISMWVPPDAQDPCGAVIILKTLLETVKQSKTGLLALDNHDTEMVGKELLNMKGFGAKDSWYGKIVDVSPLAGLVNLTGLDLRWNQIVDVAPLAGMIYLKDLGLRNNQIVDVAPLAGLTNLTVLGLDWNPIVDTSPLRSLNRKAIHGVDLGGCCTIL